MLQVPVARSPTVQRWQNQAGRGAAADTSGGEKQSDAGGSFTASDRKEDALCVLRFPQELSALTFGQLLSSGQVLPSECMNGLMELAANPNTSPALTSSIVSLLAQLGNADKMAVFCLLNLHVSLCIQRLMMPVVRFSTAATTAPALLLVSSTTTAPHQENPWYCR